VQIGGFECKYSSTPTNHGDKHIGVNGLKD
jgi:hypothetical protein